MFATIGRSWEFAKIAYGIIWDFKSLLVFPLLSGAAALLVLASFILPLWGTGTLEQWMALASDDAEPSRADQAAMWAILFAFYFASYFVMLFFNSALTACALRVVSGEMPTIGSGFAVAAKRLPQIFAWALVSAIIGVLLRAIENANEKAGRFVAAILGSAWTALTYFVVPVMVVDGAGPVEAFKRSAGTLKKEWGTALVGNFSLGILGFLLVLPVVLVCGALGYLAVASGNTAGLIATVVLGVLLIALVTAANSAADVVFKALLYNYATGKSLPAGIDAGEFSRAFKSKA